MRNRREPEFDDHTNGGAFVHHWQHAWQAYGAKQAHALAGPAFLNRCNQRLVFV